MLSKEQIAEIREHLEKAQNPVFFFDNDCDGLMAFILLRRFIGRGRGVAIKSFPELDESYAKKIDEFNADYVFVLDKPLVSEEFIREVRERNLPLVWVDHHDVKVNFDFSKEEMSNIYYFNPMILKDGSSEPVSYLAYKVANNREDDWLAMVGCIADNFIPDFSEDFFPKYPEIFTNQNPSSAFEVLYETDFGKLIMMLSFGLKDRTSNVVYMINFLFKVRSPYEILKEDDKNFKILRRYNQINSFYEKVLDKAKKVARSSKKVVFFKYSGELSLSADLSNELIYRFPAKIVIVAYVKGSVANVSVRGSEDVLAVTVEAIKSIDGANGGGHKHATGAKMNADDLQKFKDFFGE
ncbi:MAG: DHH family phosphoesterase [Candidatus Pacearchaeota archaeon]|jgi:single-stranded DNA-specific DHH superfamily exonuclease